MLQSINVKCEFDYQKVDINNLDSFIISDVEEYEAQTKRYDFDSFDNKYIELPTLQSYITEYIKTNIEKF